MAESAPAKPATGMTAEGWLTESWYFIAASRSLKAGTQRREIMLDQPVLIGRTRDGEAFALRDVCPHRLVPLSEGRQIDTDGTPTVQCPYHGWRFGADGVCRHMPSLVEGDPYDPSRIKVRTYPVHETNGMVFVYIASDPRNSSAPVVPPPDFGLGPDQPKFIVERTFNAHMDDAIVGLMDPAHVPFVHNQWWWRPPSTGFRVKEKAFEPRDRGWAIARHQPSGNSLAYKMLFGGKVSTEIVFQLPGFRWEIVENERANLVTLTCLVPVEAKKTRIVQITYWKNAPLLDLLKPVFIPAAGKFLDQDGRMVDLQNEGMKYQKSMLWIDDIDVQAKWYQALKREWVSCIGEDRTFANPVTPRTLRWRS